LKLRKHSIAYFITPHGFGHASRAAAIMAAAERLRPEIRFEIFTTSPRWIFEDSLQNAFGYHAHAVDLGLVQRSPFEEDMAATLAALGEMLPFDPQLLDSLSAQIKDLGCRVVVCDIAALGIAAARRAGLPSVLVENFTWDWIYRDYSEQSPEIIPFADYLEENYGRADHRIQAQPICREFVGAERIAPVARRPRRTREEIRRRLGLGDHEHMVLVSMGGVPADHTVMVGWSVPAGLRLVVPGADGPKVSGNRCIFLPARSGFYHPDLVAAADAVVGKAGYSTVAEVYAAGVPFGFISRPGFAESPILERFIREQIPSEPIALSDYPGGRWLTRLTHLMELRRGRSPRQDGAEAAARSIIAHLSPPTNRQ
jgi:hypothetical protein